MNKKDELKKVLKNFLYGSMKAVLPLLTTCLGAIISIIVSGENTVGVAVGSALGMSLYHNMG